MLESIVYVIPQLILAGGRQMYQGGGDILQKVLENISEKFLSSKYNQTAKHPIAKPQNSL